MSEETIPIYFCRRHEEVDDDCTDKSLIGWITTVNGVAVRGHHGEGGNHV